MQELDADNQRLSYQGRYAERDIVQVGDIFICQTRLRLKLNVLE